MGKPSTFFLAAFCLMQCLSQHLRERYSLKPCPPDISLSWQFTVMSTLVPATPEHASLAQCPEWVSLPRRACLLLAATRTFTTIGTDFFSRHVQSSHRSCLCVRKTVRTIRTRKGSPHELYNNSFSKNQIRHCWQTANILSCSFLPDAVMEPTPPGTVQFETMST